MEIIKHLLPLIDIAHAAPVEASPSVMTKSFYGMVNWIAGITILASAVYLPFQIGGIGKSIIDGFSRIYKEGKDWGKWGLTNTSAGVQVQTAVAKSPVGKFLAAFSADKKIAENDKGKVDRLNMLGAVLNKGDYKKNAKAIGSTLVSRDTQDTFVKKGSAEAILSFIDDIKQRPGFEKLLKGAPPPADIHEDMLNAVSALDILQNNALDPAQKELATKALKKLHDDGFFWDQYGNVQYDTGAKPSSDRIKDFLSNPKNLGLDEAQIAEVAKGTKINDLKDTSGNKLFSDDQIKAANDNIKSEFANYNKEAGKSNPIDNIGKLADHFKNEIDNKINAETKNIISVYQNTPLNVIEQIKNELNQANTATDQTAIKSHLQSAANLAKQHNLTNIYNQINTLPRNSGGEILTKSLDNLILNQSVNQFYNSRDNLNKYIQSNQNVKFDYEKGSAPGFTADNYQQIILNNTGQIANELSVNHGHKDITSEVQKGKDTEEKIKAIVSSKAADEEYIKTFFGNEELTNRINAMRKEFLFGTNGKLEDKHTQEILDRLKKIDNNYENTARKLTIFN